MQATDLEKVHLPLKMAVSASGPIIFDLQNLQTSKSIVPSVEGSMDITAENHSIDISYRIRALPSDAHDWFMYPLGDSSYFHFYGDHLLIHPNLPPDEKNKEIRVTLAWEGWPAKWVFANSLGIEQRKQTVYRTLDALLTTVFVGGDFQIFHSKTSPPILLATRKDFLPFASTFLEKAETIIQTQRSFWKDFSFPNYLITVLPLGPGEVSAGRGLYDSFSLCPNDYCINHLEEMVSIISHEHFHTWNGIKLPPAGQEGQLFWFTEGFTEYYAHKLNLLAGVISPEEYVVKINSIICKYWTSPAKKYSNTLVIKEYKNNNEAWDIDYFRGALLAAIWDREIQTITQGASSLDNVMHLLKDKVKTSADRITKEAIIECASIFLAERAGYDVETYIIQGNELVFPQNLLGPAYTLATQPIPQFVLCGK